MEVNTGCSEDVIKDIIKTFILHPQWTKLRRAKKTSFGRVIAQWIRSRLHNHELRQHSEPLSMDTAVHKESRKLGVLYGSFKMPKLNIIQFQCRGQSSSPHTRVGFKINFYLIDKLATLP